ncbi:MAG TPA: Uma2 family endonuclease [Bryobacteraceae bacterium]|nr:Uma2 family endonuclease [Bryobacteraceae bacterium]
MATTHTRLMTFAEFEQLPDEVCRRHELRRGELVQVAPPIHGHYLVQRRLRRALESAAGDAGVVDTEMAFRALPEYEYRVADVAFLTHDRWDKIPRNGTLAGAPELVIEVLSPSNTRTALRERGKLCLENGSREFWIVDLDHRQIEISTPDGSTRTYTSGQQIPLFFAAGATLAVDAVFS